jgi:hypothetical protein
MLIVTPILTGEIIHPQVCAGVASLGAPWLVVSLDAAYPGYEREMSINFTRARLHAEAVNRLGDASYVLLLDSDVVIPYPSAITEMKVMLADGYTAACLKTKESDHVLGACALVRADFYRTHLGPTDKPWECQCRRMARLGRVDYVQGLAAYEIPRAQANLKPQAATA